MDTMDVMDACGDELTLRALERVSAYAECMERCFYIVGRGGDD